MAESQGKKGLYRGCRCRRTARSKKASKEQQPFFRRKRTMKKAKEEHGLSPHKAHQFVKEAIINFLNELWVVFQVEECPLSFVQGLMTRCGYTKGVFTEAVRALEKDALVQVSIGKLIGLSGEGVQAIPSDFPFQGHHRKTNKEIHFRAMTILTKRVDSLMTLTELWTKLSDGQLYPIRDLENPEICKYTEPKSFAQARGALKVLNLIDDDDQEALRLTENAFPEGRPNRAHS